MSTIVPQEALLSPETRSLVPPLPVRALIEPDPDFPEPPTDLIEDDGEPLETDWHRLEITLLIDSVTQHLKDRRDYFVGGNMFVYFNREQARTRDYRGPDFFFVQDVPLEKPRRYWAIWDEGGKYPDLVIELASPTTIKEDRTVKKNIYEKTFRCKEYFIYDPDQDVLEGYFNTPDGFVPIKADNQGQMACKTLGLKLGRWHGPYQEKEYRYLRFFDAQSKPVPTLAEGNAIMANAQRVRAETAEIRAEAAEAEVARLRALLESQSGGTGTGT